MVVVACACVYVCARACVCVCVWWGGWRVYVWRGGVSMRCVVSAAGDTEFAGVGVCSPGATEVGTGHGRCVGWGEFRRACVRACVRAAGRAGGRAATYCAPSLLSTRPHPT